MPRSLLLAVTALTAAACARGDAKPLPLQSAQVTRRDIVVEAEATGTIEPINVIEVKSRASGQVLRMPVETGTLVRPGDLIVQLDTRDLEAQVEQARADVEAAKARLANAEAAKQRNDQLFAAGVITKQEKEQADLEFANAQTQIVRANSALEIQQQRLDEATVRAPVAGTIIEKPIAEGQVVQSGTSGVSGGTTIVKMADLGQVRARTYVTETDIGQVRPGMQATVRVDAYPSRPFVGVVEKIEPQAVVQQSVTMFPVLVSLENQERLLMPGMNGEVAILVDRREGVLAIPNDAIRNIREAAASAVVLGLDSAEVRQQVQAQFAAAGAGGFGGGGRGGNGGRREGAGGGAMRVQQNGILALQGGGQGPMGGRGGPGGFQMPEVSDADCKRVDDAFAKNPDAQRQLDDLRAKVRNQEIDFQAMQQQSRAIYQKLGVDQMVAAACRRRQGGGGGAPMGGPGRGPGGGAAAPAEGRPAGGAAPAAGGGAPPPVRQLRQRPGLVFVDSGDTTRTGASRYQPKVVMLGLANYDFTEVVSGLEEGERVVILNAALAQLARNQQNDRFRQMTGGGGFPGTGGGPGAGGPGGPGGGRPGGFGGGGAGGGGAPGGGARP